MSEYGVMVESMFSVLVQDIVKGIKDELSVNKDTEESKTNSRYLNKKEACEYLSVSRPTLEKFIAKGMKVAVIENSFLIDTNDIDAFIAEYKK